LPVVRGIRLKLDLEGILRRQGLDPKKEPRPEIMKVLHEAMAEVEASRLLEPAVAYSFHPIAGMQKDTVILEGGKEIPGSLIPLTFPSAEQLAVAVCTIGPKLEKKAGESFKKNEQLRGLLLDGIGSSAVDMLGQEVCHLITGEASAGGHRASSPVNPGMAGLSLSEQEKIFQLVQAEQIGVRLTSGQMMVPCKSTSLVIGVGANMPQRSQAQMCAVCPLNTRCHYKIRSAGGQRNAEG